MSVTHAVVAFASVGGVLFGLDQGNWGGAIIKEGFVEAFCDGSPEECHDAANLPADYASFLSLGSSLLQLGAAAGALVLGPPCAASKGRRETMFLGSIITILGAIPQAIVTSKRDFLCARFLAGTGVGMVTYALPMFVSEVAPAELRGALGCSMQLMMVVGTLLASMLNCGSGFSYKMSFMMPAYPAAIVAVGIFFFPRSPRFALMRGRRLSISDKGVEEAWKSLRRLRGSDQAADEELDAIQEGLDELGSDAPWSRLWTERSLWRRVIVANMLQWLQQCTGVNAILSYGPAIFQSAGVPLSGLACAVITNIFNVLGTVVMMVVIDRWGRRSLLLLGAASMLASMFGSAVLAHMIETAQARGDQDTANSLGWSLLALMCLYMSSFAIAWGGVPWVYPSEIFPMDLKEKALSTSVCSQWIANFLIAYVIPQQVQVLKVAGTLFFYSGCLIGCFGLVLGFVPETRGLPLEEMGCLFGEERSKPAANAPPAGNASSSACSLAMWNRPRSSTDPLMAASQEEPLLLASALRRRVMSDVPDKRPARIRSISSRIIVAPGGAVVLA